MQRVRSFAHACRDEGLGMALFRVWRWVILWSPLSPLSGAIVGEVYREKLRMYPSLGYWPQIRRPRTFNEKIIHRKLFSDDPTFTELADKRAARDYVRDRVGGEVLTEVYCVTADPDAIPFETLPQAFVINPTHLSGPVRIVDDKRTIDVAAVKRECREWLATEFGRDTNEYWYLDIDPQLIVEERLWGDDGGPPLDYRFFVFHGEVRLIEVDFDRFGTHKQRFFDRDWEPLPLQRMYPQGPAVDEPEPFDEMREVAETLGTGFDFVRVDLYNPSDGRVVFGELTFSPGSGYGEFRPPEYGFKLGEYW